VLKFYCLLVSFLNSIFLSHLEILSVVLISRRAHNNISRIKVAIKHLGKRHLLSRITNDI